MNRFDELVERRGSHSMKWDDLDEWFSSNEVLPMWVADMDFKCPDEVIEALKKRVEHGVFGYPGDIGKYYESVIKWFDNKQGWNVEAECICTTEGVVTAINMLIQALSEEGDRVLIQTPVYPPFYKAVSNNNRVLVENKLVYKSGRYEIDFESLDKNLEGVKIFLMCSPHNPVGRVWSKEELNKIVELTKKHDVLIISDEIHGDLVFKDVDFISMGQLKDIENRVAICTAPSKAFNIAGLQVSNIILKNDHMRKKYKDIQEKSGIHSKPNVLGLVATMAAYNHGELWLNEVMDYVEDNFKYLDEFLQVNIPSIKLIKPEGTYLAWLDCTELGIFGQELSDFFIKKCKVGVVPGYSFGNEGSNFIRLNIGCSRVILEEALKRIKSAVIGYKI